jgi:hypothetical protein
MTELCCPLCTNILIGKENTLGLRPLYYCTECRKYIQVTYEEDFSREVNWNDPYINNPENLDESSKEYHERLEYIQDFDVLFANHKEHTVRFIMAYMDDYDCTRWDPLWLKYENALDEEHKRLLRKRMLHKYPLMFK